MIEKSDSFQLKAVGGEQKLAPLRREGLYLCIYINNNFCPYIWAYVAVCI